MFDGEIANPNDHTVPVDQMDHDEKVTELLVMAREARVVAIDFFNSMKTNPMFAAMMPRPKRNGNPQ